MALRDTDYIQQIANYIKKNISKGYTMDALKFSLIGQGYSRTEVMRAISLATEQLAAEAPKLEEKPKIVVTSNPELEIKQAVEDKQGFFSRLFRRKK